MFWKDRLKSQSPAHITYFCEDIVLSLGSVSPSFLEPKLRKNSVHFLLRLSEVSIYAMFLGENLSLTVCKTHYITYGSHVTQLCVRYRFSLVSSQPLH